MADAMNHNSLDRSQLGSMMNKLFMIGRIKMVALITLVAVIMAIGIAYAIILLFADHEFPVSFVLKMAAFIPVVITPILAWPLVVRHIKLIEIEQALYFSASYDMLTGFLSRYAFFSHLEAVHKLALRNKTPLSIASIDIDEFKKINDSYGHAAGDEVLRTLGVLVKNIVRKSDFIGRVGGDEFVLVLPNTNATQASHVANTIRALIANTPVAYANTQIRLSLSIGVAQVDTLNPEMIDELLVASDKALYQAKQSGRNCVVVIDSAPVSV
jgi:diguanylate cyclase (GGDEF)-like protein